jgi:hypothetical protein
MTTEKCPKEKRPHFVALLVLTMAAVGGAAPARAEFTEQSTVEEVAQGLMVVDGYPAGPLQQRKIEEARQVLTELGRYYGQAPAVLAGKAVAIRNDANAKRGVELKILDLLQQAWLFGKTKSPQEVSFEEALFLTAAYASP